jgi:uncharacterized caspase-like protein
MNGYGILDMPLTSDKPRLHLLVIGVNRYADSTIPTLRWAVNDARAIGRFFATSISTGAIQSRLLLNEKATLSAIKHYAGERIADAARESDTVIIYFAGHGAPDLAAGSSREVEHFLVPHDGCRNRLYSTAFSLERDLADLLVRIRSENVLVVLDCCFSGAGDGRGVEGHRLRLARLHSAGNARSAIVTRSGTSIDLGRGRAMLFACGPTEQAAESSSLRHGVYTHAILSYLNSRANSARIAVALLHDAVVQSVIASSNGAQTPMLKGALQNQFVVTGLPDE